MGRHRPKADRVKAALTFFILVWIAVLAFYLIWRAA